MFWYELCEKEFIKVLLTIKENSSAEIVEKKSKFIANLFYVESEAEAEEKLNEITKISFDTIDKDKSGLIELIELEKVMSQIAGDMGAEPPTKEDVKHVFNDLDKDKSGKIDYEEFKQLIIDVLNAMIEDEDDN